MIQTGRPEDALLAFPAAWNSHDMKSFGALFRDDATFVNRFGHYVRGVQSDSCPKSGNSATAQQVEVEVVENRLVYRSAVSEQRLFLDRLQSIEQASKFEPIKLVFTAAPPFMLDGLHDADKLVEELAVYVR
ncbi:MAG: hypothetical protein JWO28_2208 [Hyphomicrobiales bacterium]|nr:hypothetical protein [Hyphomicrobiales bacterium]